MCRFSLAYLDKYVRLTSVPLLQILTESQSISVSISVSIQSQSQSQFNMSELHRIFQTSESLNEIPDILAYIHNYKQSLNNHISQEIQNYEPPQDVDTEIKQLTTIIAKSWDKSQTIQNSINHSTKEISKLDNLKRNLTLSMNIFKRLQILNITVIELNKLLSTNYDYERIYNNLKNLKELMVFFKDYKSINQINQINQMINKIEVKLVDSIFIDFEENKGDIYSCLILELIDKKYKDKLLTWYYNLQLKDIKLIFNTNDEAGSLDNLSRRFIYFNNTLEKLSNKDKFPQEWNVELELCKIFVAITKEDLIKKLTNIKSSVLLNCINITIEFENSMNAKFKTTYFSKILSKIFEPYLNVWITEQETYLQGKLSEFQRTIKIPIEFQVNNETDLLKVLKVNNVPNISSSSLELFKISNKLINQLSKISTGKIMKDLSNVLNRWLNDHRVKMLLPIIEANDTNELTKTELIVYFTMVINTADYIINNLNDLVNKFKDFNIEMNVDNVKDNYLYLINNTINKLINLLSNDLGFSWRQFENTNWEDNEILTISNYVSDFKSSIENNVKLILPLIIRESYIKSFNNKLVESLIKEFINKLKVLNRGISINCVEQLLKDVKNIEEFLITLPNFSDPNNQIIKQDNFFNKFVYTQTSKLKTILDIIKAPSLPVDDFIEQYFEIVGDKNVNNFRKVLWLKGIETKKYIDAFNLQLSIANDLPDNSPLSLMDPISFQPQTHPIKTSLPPQPVEKKGTFNFLSPDESRAKLEKNLREFTINSENNINKLNENFKNFGKLFRKDDN